MLGSRKIIWEEAEKAVGPRIKPNGVLERSFEPAFPVDVRFYRCRDPLSPLHRHDYLELSYLESGEVLYQVQDRILPMCEGDLFVINGALLHRVTKSLRPGLREILLQFRPGVLTTDHRTVEDWLYLTPFLGQDQSFPHVVTAKTGIPAEVRDLVTRIHAHLPASNPRDRLTVKTYLKMILVLLVNHYSSHTESSGAVWNKHQGLRRLKPLLDFVAQHYREPITVSDGAAILHMSRPHFMRLFRNTMGETFVSYVNRLRVEKAEALLASTDKTIAEIGLEAGFKDQSYFGQVFRKLVNLTPREYRSGLQQN